MLVSRLGGACGTIIDLLVYGRINLLVYGRKLARDVDPEMPLLWALRDELGMEAA